MAPKSLSTWMQHLGRAGQSGSSAVSILLVEPYVFQLKKAKEQDTNKIKRVHNKPVPINGIKQEDIKDVLDSEYEGLQDEDSANKGAMQLHDVDIWYRKKFEGGLRSWIDPQHYNCRREVSNSYFRNPPSHTGAWSAITRLIFSLTHGFQVSLPPAVICASRGSLLTRPIASPPMNHTSLHSVTVSKHVRGLPIKQHRRKVISLETRSMLMLSSPWPIMALARGLVAGTILKHVKMHLDLGESRYGDMTLGGVA